MSYAVSCGIPMVAAVTIYSVEGLAGMGGRIAFGLLGDRFGAKRVLVLGLLAQAFGALGYVFVRELAAFYAVAALFGFIYAGTMPLYAVLARENFPLRMMGTVIGGTAMAGSLGMATGPLAGGLIYDTFASYTWLYIGSWVMGLGAFLIAMTFRPMPAAQDSRAGAGVIAKVSFSLRPSTAVGALLASRDCRIAPCCTTVACGPAYGRRTTACRLGLRMPSRLKNPPSRRAPPAPRRSAASSAFGGTPPANGLKLEEPLGAVGPANDPAEESRRVRADRSAAPARQAPRRQWVAPYAGARSP